MTTATAIPDYAAVLAMYPPRIIRTEEEDEHYTSVLYELDQRSESLTLAERELADLLTLLIEDFESKHHELPKASPVEVLRFLMDQHSLRQRDLLDVFGSPSIVSEVLSGKRELSKDHIRKLAERFRIPVEMLF